MNQLVFIGFIYSHLSKEAQLTNVFQVLSLAATTNANLHSSNLLYIQSV